MRNEFKEQAERSVKSRLVLDAIAKAEKLENSEEEIAEKIKEIIVQMEEYRELF